MKKLLIAALSLLMLSPAASVADEGMWLLPFLNKNIKDMRKAGFRLSADDIYSVNKHALKDAIVIFGNGCTGEVVSSQGLVLTNHHCGYGAIQQHSTVENDYLQDGFWAMDFKQEIPTPGLAVTFIRSIEDVTATVLDGVTEDMTAEERSEKIGAAIQKIAEERSIPEENISANVESMFGGNQFILFMQERFGDVRMVGAPPSSIGKYGGDTDNWMWPRHTGDFSIFRIYSSKDGKSTSEYSADNVPYNAPKHLTVSSKGVKDGDFAMIMGFPGSTSRYMTTWEVDRTLNQENPIRIFMRGEKQQIWSEDMAASQKVRIQYSSKFAGSSNYWKNAIGMSRGLKKLDVRTTKQEDQDRFTAWVNADEARKAKYGEALSLIEAGVTEANAGERDGQIFNELISGAEAYLLAYQASNILRQKIVPAEQEAQLASLAEGFFKDYNAPTDKRASYRLFQIAADSLSAAHYPTFLNFAFGNKYEENFDKSPFTSKERFMEAAKGDFSALTSDPIYNQSIELINVLRACYGENAEADAKFRKGHRLYLAGLMEMNEGKKLMYPDANFTMRLTYGNVKSYKAADAVHYDYYTTLDGLMAKEDPTNPEFEVPAKLKELWKNKDYGRWATKDGEMQTCFISTNDITGGNSGSPIMNAKGELIGLAFDGNWEAMSGDIAFEPDVQRTINIDIRYLLFIIDKYADCDRLIDEMTIR